MHWLTLAPQSAASSGELEAIKVSTDAGAIREKAELRSNLRIEIVPQKKLEPRRTMASCLRQGLFAGLAIGQAYHIAMADIAAENVVEWDKREKRQPDLTLFLPMPGGVAL
jgi:hypothetical protein